MKRILIFSLLGLLLLGSLVIAELSSRNVTFDSNVKTFLDSINNDSVEVGDIICNEDSCSQRMWKGDYQLGEVSVNRRFCDSYGEVAIDETTNLTEKVCISWSEITDKEIRKNIQKAQENKLKEIEKVAKTRVEKKLLNKTIVDAITITY